MNAEILMQQAWQAQKNAYAPYSGFKVGAALVTGSGLVYCGANVENSSLGLTVCAERIAVFKGVNAGENDFKAIAVAASSNDLIYPCGACLQVLAEFTSGLKIYLAEGKKHICCFSLNDFLPFRFSLNR
ncbi:MAG: cytidine deaminase [Syntrophomonadaceae bacterium]|nr:cytidine deaminase [Syntrophomonadaceae bacterium]